MTWLVKVGPLIASALVILMTARIGAAAPLPDAPRPLRLHDPSSILKEGEVYWVFATGNGIISAKSRNLLHWESGPRVFALLPAWTTNAVPENRGHFWAPDQVQISNRFYLYYSVSSWGKTTSAIGLALNSTLNPEHQAYAWKDQGLVISTGSQANYNAIDPSVLMDTNGHLWLAFGSFWSGIKLIELNPETGLRVATNSPVYSLAWNESIEAACLYHHGDHYYLFVNWGQCCKGTNSTYEIRVGRSATITGPYLDQDGKDMLQGGGTLFLATEEHRIGPGHAAVFHHDGTDYLSYHYYDARNSGLPRVQVRVLNWNDASWPLAGRLIEPPLVEH